MTKRLIAVVDDEPDILHLVKLHLERASFDVALFERADPFMNFLENTLPDLVILDLMLPDMDGRDVCSHVRRTKKTETLPVIMLTARANKSDRVEGLDLGADDYVTKPFSPEELVARVRAVLRRSGDKSGICVGDILSLDKDRFSVEVKGQPVELTASEFKILFLLCSHPSIVFSRGEILDRLWGNEKAVLDRTVDVHIKHIREKLGPDAGPMIRNIRGVGYKVQL